MTTTRKKTVDKADKDAGEATKVGLFAQLEAEAMEGINVHEPFVIDDVDPPIVITEPVESDRVVALGILYRQTSGGDQIEPTQFHPLLRALCGNAYDRVWNELLRNAHINVTTRFIKALLDHFRPQGPAAGKGGAEAVPGGSLA
ncbi:Uncharacterised protein [Mycobacteroides abscessus subsp. abscessus]|nr:Uncharacterised protein [Mycobacteroides abscessus subsp. abscessus]